MNRPLPQPGRFAALGLILIHLVVSMLHGQSASGGVRSHSSTFGYLYVLIVIMLAPLVAGVLLFTRLRRAGALLLALSMFGSFLFGCWYHFLSATSDNVVQFHGPWHSTFLWTAVALAVIELAGTLVGLWLYRRSSIAQSA
jgi:hypothetical protein